jgi:hypothetical protein
MSQMGHKQTFRIARALSALPPKGDMCSATAHVRFGSIVLKKSAVATHEVP